MTKHVFALTGAVAASIVAALTMCGMLLFLSGLIVGIGVEAPPAQRVATAERAQTPADVGRASAGDGDAGAAATTVFDAGNWPFSQSTAPVDTAPTPGAGPGSASHETGPATQPTHHAGVVGVAFVETPVADDDSVVDSTPYVVQIGAFRIEGNARALMERLKHAGYHPVLVQQVDGGRPLNIVRVQRIVGREAAARVAERIGDAERVVASIVIDNSRP
jgi:cell division septation protein DedD